MNEIEVYNIMINEYKDACGEYYETRFGEKCNTKYTINNLHTDEVISGVTSGCRIDDTSEEVMRVIRRMMCQIFGDQVKEQLKEIRKEERVTAKNFFKENPQYVVYVTDIR